MVGGSWEGSHHDAAWGSKAERGSLTHFVGLMTIFYTCVTDQF